MFHIAIIDKKLWIVYILVELGFETDLTIKWLDAETFQFVQPLPENKSNSSKTESQIIVLETLDKMLLTISIRLLVLQFHISFPKLVNRYVHVTVMVSVPYLMLPCKETIRKSTLVVKNPHSINLLNIKVPQTTLSTIHGFKNNPVTQKSNERNEF